ncbi:WG repeat-containing protein [Xanthocytophaga flava]|uniref:WG repeat-containing protein n=1 Tax=Xanthocytophaga flava TaxID=3048013 RepID=UPI0028D219A1|nr:WG repeat-containing protein [Xanthocytophaga flavus]MDJ1468254.1 WG repeat-containing protein [Xanthocytophaga flavus]
MKVLILNILLLFSIASLAVTQTDDLEKALKALKEKDFNAAKVLIEQIITKNSFDAGGYYALAVYYADNDNKPHDYYKSLDYLILAEKYYSTLTTKELANLQKLGVTLHEMQKLKQSIGQQAVQEAISSQNPAAIDKVISKFSSLPDVVEKAIEYKNVMAFEDTKRVNTYQAYQNFYIKYPSAKQVPEAKSKYEQLLYESLTSDQTWQSYQKFYKSYPNSPYAERAKKQYEKLYYEQNVASSTSANTIERYITENPSSVYAPKAKTQLQSMSSLFPIRVGDTWGFINGNGQIVIPPIYERVGKFAEGMARVRKNGKWGIINTKGKEIIPPIYELIRDFSEGVTAVIQRKKKVLEAFYIDSTGKQLFAKTYVTDGSYWPIHSFQEGLAVVEDPESHKVGFINKKGEFVVAPLFNSYIPRKGAVGTYPFSSFSEGYAWVKNEEGTGLIDKNGVFLIKGSYNQSLLDTLSAPPFYYKSFSSGMCLLEESNSSFYIDRNAKKAITIPVGFTALPFSDEVAWTYSKYDKKFYLIDNKGKTILDIPAFKVYPFHEDRAVIQKDAPANRVYFYDQTPDPTYSFIDKTGKLLFDFKFDIPNDPLFEYSSFKNGLACVLLNGKQTYINKEGKVVWQSPERWN